MLICSHRAASCSVQKLKCVENIKIEDYGCFPPCSGLIVTGHTKYEKNVDLNELFPIFDDYNKYKLVTEHPSGYDGRYEYMYSIISLIISKI